jgi:hypothetical protein
MPQTRTQPVSQVTQQEAAVSILRALVRDGVGLSEWLFYLIQTIAHAPPRVRARLRVFEWAAYVEAVETYEAEGGQLVLMERAGWEMPGAQLSVMEDEPRLTWTCPDCQTQYPNLSGASSEPGITSCLCGYSECG